MRELRWVKVTKSQTHNKNNDQIYKWIDELKENPENNDIQEKIVLTYQKLVESLARKYSMNAIIQEDLIQVGMIGLLAAVKRYDPEYGRSFETFAIPTILGEIKRYIRDQTWSVHVPRRIKELGPKIKRAADEITNNNQRVASVKEIADYLEVSEEDVLETMEMGKSYRALSVDRKVDSSDDGSSVAILDVVGSNENQYGKVEQQMLLEKIMPVLSEREQQILRCTFFENMSQKETGELLGVSQMHVSRLQRNSLRKLRDAMPSESTEVFR